jgi:GDP-L-fucose synthase
MELDSAIFVAGHRGLAGSAILRRLARAGHSGIVTRGRGELDLRDQEAVDEFFRSTAIDYVFMSAGRVGGIVANRDHQADFLYDNLIIAANVIHAAAEHGVKKLLYLGSSCIYPRETSQPMREESILTGPLESTNEGYAIAKIAGLKLCEMYARQYGKRFITAMPTNLYGPGDNFHPTQAHVIPGLLRRFHEALHDGAEQIVLWGSGTARREFLHVDDLADALYLLMERYEDARPINVGTGEDCTIAELAHAIAEVVGFRGEMVFDRIHPDGTPRKLLDVSRIGALGWRHSHTLKEGLTATYGWAVAHGVFEHDHRVTA